MVDVHEAVERDVFDMARYWNVRKFQFVDVAAHEFEVLVDPAIAYGEEPSFEETMAYNQAFTEWLLFERVAGDGMTLLERYVAEPPASAGAESVERLRQVVRTQFFSRFAIAGKDVRSGRSELVDLQTGRSYDVWDPGIARKERWRDGALAVRIAEVEGEWLAIGQLRLYDIAPAAETSVDGPGAVHPEDLAAGFDTSKMCFYLRLIRDVMGYDGRCAPSLNVMPDA